MHERPAAEESWKANQAAGRRAWTPHETGREYTI